MSTIIKNICYTLEQNKYVDASKRTIKLRVGTEVMNLFADFEFHIVELMIKRPSLMNGIPAWIDIYDIPRIRRIQHLLLNNLLVVLLVIERGEIPEEIIDNFHPFGINDIFYNFLIDTENVLYRRVTNMSQYVCAHACDQTISCASELTVSKHTMTIENKWRNIASARPIDNKRNFKKNYYPKQPIKQSIRHSGIK